MQWPAIYNPDSDRQRSPAKLFWSVAVATLAVGLIVLAVLGKL